MKAEKLVGVLVGLLVALLLAWLAEWRKTVHDFDERLRILQERTARSEESEFYVKQTLERIEKNVEKIAERNE